jgi:uncharacterized protein
MNDRPPLSAIVSALRIREGAQAAFFSWQARMTAAAAAAPGFLSIEFMPVLGTGGEWQMMLQFRDAPSLAEWRSSDSRNQLHEELQSLLHAGMALNEAPAPDLHAQGSVTEAIATRVSPAMKAGFLDWSARIQQAQARFPGYRGMYLQSPTGAQPFWTTLVRFATPGELDSWLASPERRSLIEQSETLVQSWSSRRLANPFAGWFAAEEGRGAPPNWKQSMVVLAMLFPIVVLELRFLTPLTQWLNPVLGTFVGNAVSVWLLAWPVMPLANRALDWWLRPPSRISQWITGLGLALLLGFYAGEILAFEWLR